MELYLDGVHWMGGVACVIALYLFKTAAAQKNKVLEIMRARGVTDPRELTKDGNQAMNMMADAMPGIVSFIVGLLALKGVCMFAFFGGAGILSIVDVLGGLAMAGAYVYSVNVTSLYRIPPPEGAKTYCLAARMQGRSAARVAPDVKPGVEAA